MTLKNIKTILFAGLIVAMILPFSGMNYAEAEKASYKLTHIDHAFEVGSKYISVDSDNIMTVDKDSMMEDLDVIKKDIQILKHWARIHNETIEVKNSGDPELIQAHIEKTKDGRFSNLVDTIVPQLGEITTQSHPGQNFWSLTACGITYGQTQHANPPAIAGLDNYSTLTVAQNQLSVWGYIQMSVPYTLPADVGFDYGKINSNGIGGCTGGEFRDEHFLYEFDRTLQPSGTVLESVHSLRQINEPNPNLAEYTPPTWWWDTYVFFWHDAN